MTEIYGNSVICVIRDARYRPSLVHLLKESSVRVILESLIWIYKMRLKKTSSAKVTTASLLMDQGKFVRTTVAVSNVLLLRCSSGTFSRDFALALLLTNFLKSYRITNLLSIVSYFQHCKKSKQFSCNNIYLCKIFNLIIIIISDLIFV